MLRPPAEISTTHCAETTRYIRTGDGGKRLWSLALTPYVAGPQDALDNPGVKTVLVPGPARSGKTIAGENHSHKRFRYGPRTDQIIYLPGEMVDEYADKDFATYLELHPDIAAKIGTGRGENKKTAKRIDGRFFSILPANTGTIRGRQAPFIRADEIDGWTKRLRSNFKQQMDIRGRAFGRGFKAYACSHPDAGSTDGITAAYLESNCGEWWWPCPHCKMWSSPCPFAEWRTKLDYQRFSGLPKDQMLEKVKETAGLLCPHCGTLITNEHKYSMNIAGKWVFQGQTISPDGTIGGAPVENDTWGFWIHGTMSPFVTWGELAKEHCAAVVFFEETGNSTRIREVTAKSIGEPYAGPTGKRVEAKMLARRGGTVGENGALPPGAYRMGTVPAGVRFIVVSVDTGGAKWDYAAIGFGADMETWLIERATIVATPDGRKVAPGKRPEDWDVLKPLLQRSYPMADGSGRRFPVAMMLVDAYGVPGVTANAWAWSSRMGRGVTAAPNDWRLALIKGSRFPHAPEIPPRPRLEDRDASGEPIDPPVRVYDLGVYKLKKAVLELLPLEGDGAGVMHMPIDCPAAVSNELLAEPLIDDEFVRQGPNETLDLYAYAHAGRMMLKPDRSTLNWNKPPWWGRPIEPEIVATPTSAGARQETKAKPLTPAEKREARRKQLVEKLKRG